MYMAKNHKHDFCDLFGSCSGASVWLYNDLRLPYDDHYYFY